MTEALHDNETSSIIVRRDVRSEVLPAARRSSFCLMGTLHHLTDTRTCLCRRRAIIASLPTGIIAPEKIQVTSTRPLDKLPVAAE